MKGKNLALSSEAADGAKESNAKNDAARNFGGLTVTNRLGLRLLRPREAAVENPLLD
jgi:hypothetical protein